MSDRVAEKTLWSSQIAKIKIPSDAISFTVFLLVIYETFFSSLFQEIEELFPSQRKKGIVDITVANKVYFNVYENQMRSMFLFSLKHRIHRSFLTSLFRKRRK
jgi:hypothetical protein